MGKEGIPEMRRLQPLEGPRAQRMRQNFISIWECSTTTEMSNQSVQVATAAALTALERSEMGLDRRV